LIKSCPGIRVHYTGIITVQNGSELIIDGGKLVNANITVQNGGKLTLRNNGTIVLNNDAVTVNAGGLFDFNYGDIQVIN
jgi:phage gp45-like